jgi:hypothetical protein
MLQSTNKLLGIRVGHVVLNILKDPTAFIFKDQTAQSSWTTVPCGLAYNASPLAFETTHLNA